ncbi:MAG: PDZ domain-containing protein [Magnetospirillum sp. WYHS-4]
MGSVRLALAAMGVACLASGSTAAGEAGFVGMQIQGSSAPVAQALGLPQPKGVLVRDVALGGPAAEAGFRRGDLILRFDNREVSTFEGLLALVRETRVGVQVPVTVLRGGQTVDLTLRTGEWPAAWKVVQNAVATLPHMGVTLASLTQKTREAFELRWGTTGVVVSLLDPDKEGAKVLRRGEVVLQVNQEDVWLPEQVLAQVEKAKAAGRPNLLILVEGRDGFRYSLLPVK